MVAAICIGAFCYLPSRIGLPNEPLVMSQLEQLFLGPTAKTLQSIGAAIVFYLIWLRGGHLFLSARIFAIIGRVSYSTFMGHMLVLWYENSLESRGSRSFRPFDVAQRFLGAIVVSNLLGLIIYLFFEAPSFNVTKAFFSKAASKKLDTNSKCSSGNRCSLNNSNNVVDGNRNDTIGS